MSIKKLKVILLVVVLVFALVSANSAQASFFSSAAGFFNKIAARVHKITVDFSKIFAEEGGEGQPEDQLPDQIGGRGSFGISVGNSTTTSFPPTTTTATPTPSSGFANNILQNFKGIFIGGATTTTTTLPPTTTLPTTTTTTLSPTTTTSTVTTTTSTTSSTTTTTTQAPTTTTTLPPTTTTTTTTLPPTTTTTLPPVTITASGRVTDTSGNAINGVQIYDNTRTASLLSKKSSLANIFDSVFSWLKFIRLKFNLGRAEGTNLKIGETNANGEVVFTGEFVNFLKNTITGSVSASNGNRTVTIQGQASSIPSITARYEKDSVRQTKAITSTNGTMDFSVKMEVSATTTTIPPSQNQTTVIIRARGTRADGQYPIMQLRQGVNALGSWTVTKNPVDYTYTSQNALAAQNLEVVFTNDLWSNGEDRNLTVDSITVNGTVYLSNSPTVYVSDCNTGYLQTITLYCNNSSFEYPTFGAAPSSFVPLLSLQLLFTHPEAVAQPTAYGKIIHTLHDFDGRIYSGYGDYGANTGPIAIRSYNPLTKNSRVEYVMRTEQIDRYMNIGDRLYAAAIDPGAGGNNKSPSGENIVFGQDVEYAYRKLGSSAWVGGNNTTSKFEHVFDIASLDGKGIWLFGSVEPGDAAAIHSPDGGATWDPKENSANLYLPGATAEIQFWNRLYFGGTLNGKIYTQSGFYNKSRIYNPATNVWTEGPNLLPSTGSSDSSGSRPLEFAGKMVYITGYNKMLAFDGSHVSEPLQSISGLYDTAIDFQNYRGYLYVLAAGKKDYALIRTADFRSWEAVGGVAMVTSANKPYSFRILDNIIYVGMSNAQILSVPMPTTFIPLTATTTTTTSTNATTTTTLAPTTTTTIPPTTTLPPTTTTTLPPTTTTTTTSSTTTTTLPPSAAGDYTVSKTYLGRRIDVTACSKFGGAVCSVKLDGRELIDSVDNGRLLQTATTFSVRSAGGYDALTECYNPTEGGGFGSQSKLLEGSVNNGAIHAKTQMAFWYSRDADVGYCADHPATPNYALSNHYLEKNISIGYRDIDNVIVSRGNFTVPSENLINGKTMNIGSTAYMRMGARSKFYSYDPKKRELILLSDTSPEYEFADNASVWSTLVPVIAASEDGKYAMAIYRPDSRTYAAYNWHSPLDFGGDLIAGGDLKKWDVDHNRPNIQPGTYQETYYVPVGSLSEVVTALDKLYSYLPTALAQGNEAVFVSQTVPAVMQAGKTYSVSVTMKNIGTATWTKTAWYRLGSQSPKDNQTWGPSRVELSGSDSIASGQQKTFTFNVTAPSVPGIYNFQWRMVQEFIEWFGDYTTKGVTVNVTTSRSSFFGGDIFGQILKPITGWVKLNK